jgi:hypothetical protein
MLIAILKYLWSWRGIIGDGDRGVERAPLCHVS